MFRCGTRSILMLVTVAGPLLSSAACNRVRDQQVGGSAEHDQAPGIEIFHDLSREDREPTCGVTPSLRIGVRDGSPEEEFDRVVDAVLLDSGGMAVVNRGTREVRFFSAAGDFLFRIGGEGGGPGEFRDPIGIELLAPDSLAVWDWRTYRVSVFTLDGAFVRITDRLVTPPRTSGVGWFWVLPGGPPFAIAVESAPSPPERAGALVDRQFHVVRFGRDGGAVLDTVETISNGKIGHIRPGRLGRPIFNPEGQFASSGGLLASSGGTSPVVEVLDQSHGLRRILRWQSPDRSVKPADVRLYFEDALSRWAGDPRSRAAILEVRDVIPVPDSFPAVGKLLIDWQRNIWVQRYTRPTWTSSKWWAFSEDGDFICEMELPARTSVFEIGKDFILARTTDEFDVEYIELFNLSRPSVSNR